MVEFSEWFPKSWTSRAPRQEMERIKGHLEGIYQALSEGYESFRGSGGGIYPAVNLSEDAENLYLKAELPGVAPGDLELSMEGQSLVIRGERKTGPADPGANVHRQEREAGTFRRVVQLPTKVDGDRIGARLKDGILWVTLPKPAESKARVIEIQAD